MQKEASGQDDAGFAVFPTAPAGWRAADSQIDLDQQRSLTIAQFIRKFAPPTENDTENYLEFVTAELAVNPKYIKELEGGGYALDPNTPIALLSDFALAAILAQMEGYYAK